MAKKKMYGAGQSLRKPSNLFNITLGKRSKYGASKGVIKARNLKKSM